MSADLSAARRTDVAIDVPSDDPPHAATATLARPAGQPVAEPAGQPAAMVSSGLPGHERPAPVSIGGVPTTPVGARFVVPFALAQLGLFIALLGPVMVSMALKVLTIVPADRATTAQGLVLGVGALAALLANPVFGYLSDRTTSRWGRRRPYMVGGSVGLAACLLLISAAQNVPTLVVGWFLAQICANACFAAYLATIADQVPQRQAATITALGGVMQNVGILAALYIATALSANMTSLFMVPALIGVAGMVLYSAVLPDRRLTRKPRPLGVREVGRMFWVSPRKHPDFAWAWVSRALLVLGSFMFSTFRLFWMTDELGLSAQDAARTVSTGVLIYTAVLVVVGQTAGWVSDRIGRRKVLVFASTALFGVGLALLTQVSTVGHFYVVEAILGAAYGIYMGVDLALVLAVLPDPEDCAKDLGVFNIANAAPQSLAPFLGAGLLAIGGGQNFTLLYLTAGALTVLGALAIVPVKKVK